MAKPNIIIDKKKYDELIDEKDIKLEDLKKEINILEEEKKEKQKEQDNLQNQMDSVNEELTKIKDQIYNKKSEIYTIKETIKLSNQIINIEEEKKEFVFLDDPEYSNKIQKVDSMIENFNQIINIYEDNINSLEVEISNFKLIKKDLVQKLKNLLADYKKIIKEINSTDVEIKFKKKNHESIIDSKVAIIRTHDNLNGKELPYSTVYPKEKKSVKQKFNSLFHKQKNV